MKSKATKTVEVEELRQEFRSSPSAFLCAFEGIKVAEDFELRKQIRARGGKYRVVKNRLARLAAEGTAFEGPLSKLRGTTSLAIAPSDPVGLIKALVAYAKDHPVFQFKAGVVEGRVLDVDGLNDLSKFPSREELLAKLLYLINAPAQRLLTVISAPARDLAIVVNQGVEKKKFKE
jgi:large subunit ribosomal protein L10